MMNNVLVICPAAIGGRADTNYVVRHIPEDAGQMMQNGDGECPFAFNFDEKAFKVGDTVSYRVSGELANFPFVGTLLEVHDDHVVIAADPADPSSRMRGTRESRPVVAESEIR